MTASRGQEGRDVIPRWRGVASSLRSGELAPTAPTESLTPEQLQLLEDREALWIEMGTESFATEFVATARLLGRPEKAREALDVLLTNPSLKVAQSLLSEEVDVGSAIARGPLPLNPDLYRKPKERIHKLREVLLRDPRNSIAWSEYARACASLGYQKKAQAASRISLALSPTSRYLLRSAACFYASIGKPEEAWSILGDAPNTQSDPWLLAAFLATGRASGKSVSGIRHIRAILDDGNFAPRELTELASQLGTYELESNGRKARKCFQKALIDPTENSLAQVEWASQRASGLIVLESSFDDPFAFEARTRRASQEGDWVDAAVNAANWQADQLFSSDAAMSASHAYAAGLSDWEESYVAARMGLVAHPDEAGLLNNAAYALIELGRLGDAAKLLEKINMEKCSTSTYVSVSATKGLLSFRAGFPLIGEEQYEAGITVARVRRESTREAMALIMLAREKANFSRDGALETLAKAERISKGTKDKSVERWLGIVRELLGR